MKAFFRIAVPAAVVCMAGASGAFAQAPTPPQSGPAQQMQAPRQLSQDAQQRLEDGKLAAARATLKLSDAQAKLWAPVEEKIKAGWADSRKLRQEAAERRQQSQAQQQPVPLPDRIQQISQRMADRAQKLKDFDTVLRPFYDSLSADQKAVVGPVLAELRGAGRAHGHFAGHRHRMMMRG